MLWDIEIRARQAENEVDRVRGEYRLLAHAEPPADFITAASRGYLVEGDLDREQARELAAQVLVDEVAEVGAVRAWDEPAETEPVATVLPRPGVMDPVALSVASLGRELGLRVEQVRTYRRYYGKPLAEDVRNLLFRRVLANEAVEQVAPGLPRMDHLRLGSAYDFARRDIAIRDLDETALVTLSKAMGLALSGAEMLTIQSHYRALSRDPVDVELETIAQTWSEHCSHKTLKGRIEAPGKTYQNMLKETIFAGTVEVRRRLGPDDWCVSVFEDNAGVVLFDEENHLVFKVETHNRPSAIEPYGGASTGIGGVIRDALGTGLGARPVCDTDVFCFGPLDIAARDLPEGVLHPRKVMRGVVSGVRDYGNRMGIPTVNGAVRFHPDYLANPLVFCGTVGLLPVNKVRKEVRDGDLIVAIGGRTGRDGIHGATFSSEGLSNTSEKTAGGAVQIGNAIEEKKVLEAVMRCRDKGLYRAITDCGAGGFSSAVGEMAADLGATVDIDKAPLKYSGLTYVEAWISESQERMVLAVPPGNWDAMRNECAAEGVEATALGRFEATGLLRLNWHGRQVGELDMAFLHDGRPPVTRKATFAEPVETPLTPPAGEDFSATLLRLLATPDIASKEWVIRQYDHEVQGGSVIKPLVGLHETGPSDAAVVAPVPGKWKAFAVGCGIHTRLGRTDAYAMAACAIDEAVRNVVAVGADPDRIALLDNFCWADTDRPEELGLLVRSAEACHDLAVAWMMPFISGKDSLKNEYKGKDRRIAIPPTLLISALGQVADARQAVSMDFKSPGHHVYLVGASDGSFAGSAYAAAHGLAGGRVPRVNPGPAKALFSRLYKAIAKGLCRAVHDLAEGGVAVAAAEMALAGHVGCDLAHLSGAAPGLGDAELLFGESPTRFLVEVVPDKASEFEAVMAGSPCHRVGGTTREPRVRIAGTDGTWVIWATIDDITKAFRGSIPTLLGEPWSSGEANPAAG
jgi:phosphoribosylformylglycinamidine synthase